ncbi:aldehyde dehydrogenase family protein [Paraburkholderia rhynchosiae]|uniref:Malonate-semialdehyde dehydrogenase n=1 Tax=Paraburkholderia rhynchosiae TaxID=487049 RepID=A0A6J5CH04_9BURK|nr:aldehyde dehydrogenase family protein [Paraburkholderia rhynchosiae]CAB3733699.1 Malonate-semialdehyde dehydrogenase [Paraburkholderia rhynchosiae]
MRNNLQFYINGSWVEPAGNTVLGVINPADEPVAGKVAIGDAHDVDRAVAAVRAAFETFSLTSVEAVLRCSTISSPPTSGAPGIWPKPFRRRWARRFGLPSSIRCLSAAQSLCAARANYGLQ